MSRRPRITQPHRWIEAKAFSLNWSKVMKIAESEGSAEDNPRLQALLDQADELYLTVAEALAPLTILGPQVVAGCYLDMQLAYEAGDQEAFGRAEVAFQEAARKALDVDS